MKDDDEAWRGYITTYLLGTCTLPTLYINHFSRLLPQKRVKDQ